MKRSAIIAEKVKHAADTSTNIYIGQQSAAARAAALRDAAAAAIATRAAAARDRAIAAAARRAAKADADNKHAAITRMQSVASLEAAEARARAVARVKTLVNNR